MLAAFAFASRERKKVPNTIFILPFLLNARSFCKFRDSNKYSSSDLSSLFSFERKIPCAEKERHGHERKVNDAENVAKLVKLLRGTAW